MRQITIQRSAISALEPILALIDRILVPISDSSLEYWAYILGSLGTVLVATNTSISGFGFVVWVPANIVSLALMRRKNLNKMVLLYLIHTVITLLGIYRWFLA